MTETQRETVPRVGDGELATALAFLDFARGCVIKKADGLTEEQARRRLVPTETTMIGLLRHLVDGERWWFGYHLAGDPAAAVGVDFEMAVPPEVTVADAIQAYRAAIADSNAAIRAVGDPDAPMAELVDGQPLPMRWVLAHMTGETVRHAGHADILRELLDGVTGR